EALRDCAPLRGNRAAYLIWFYQPAVAGKTDFLKESGKRTRSPEEMPLRERTSRLRPGNGEELEKVGVPTSLASFLPFTPARLTPNSRRSSQTHGLPAPRGNRGPNHAGSLLRPMRRRSRCRLTRLRPVR